MAAGAELNDLEQRARAAVKAGEPLDCAREGTTPADLDAVDDWDQRVITAQLLAELCTRQGASDPRIGVRVRGAYVTGTVDLARADVHVPLLFEVCRFEKDVDLTEAHIRSLRAIRCEFPTLLADELESDHSLYLSQSRVFDMVLTDARIHGGIYLAGATLTNDDGPAFNGDGLSTTGDANFDGVVVTGELRLVDARIDGGIYLVGAKLTNDDGPALNGDRLTCGRASFDGVVVTGELRLLGAQIGASLNLVGAKLTNDNGPALSGDFLTCGRANFNEVVVTGELRLLGAQIGGQFSLVGAKLTNDNGRALNGQEMRSAALVLRTRSTIQGTVDLTAADVENLVDSLSSWPKRVLLDGFSYRAFPGAEDRDVASRLTWIRRNLHYAPGVYDQLANVYRRAGQDQDARDVAIARESDRLDGGQLSVPSKLWNRFLGVTAAHGYKPWRAGLILLGVVAVSTVLFQLPAAERVMAPTKSDPPIASARDCTPGYECFEPWIYSLDVVLPVVDLHQESNWLPSADQPWGDWYRALTWGLIAIGWLLTTALVAAIGTVWRR